MADNDTYTPLLDSISLLIGLFFSFFYRIIFPSLHWVVWSREALAGCDLPGSER